MKKTDCPKRFCFHFIEKGCLFAAGFHDDVDAATDHLVRATDDRCGCELGICTRAAPLNGDRDWYEPHEPNLDAARLPRDHFTSPPL